MTDLVYIPMSRECIAFTKMVQSRYQAEIDSATFEKDYLNWWPKQDASSRAHDVTQSWFRFGGIDRQFFIDWDIDPSETNLVRVLKYKIPGHINPELDGWDYQMALIAATQEERV